MDVDDDESERRSAPASSSENNARVQPIAKGVSSDDKQKGFSFNELVDRLVAQPMSKQESKFACVFLCLYRKFAEPSTLLVALISRFERNEATTADQLALASKQLHLLTVTAQWAADYPGDFAHTKTRKMINEFIAVLERSPFYMFAAKEISYYIEGCTADDAGWPYRDDDDDDDDDVRGGGTRFPEKLFDESPYNTPADFLSGSLMQGSGEQQNEANEEEEDPLYNIRSGESNNNIATTEASSKNASSPPGSNATLNLSLTSLTLEAAQKGAQHLDLRPRFPLTKTQWRQFMEIPDEDFARELTRIDWIMYNSFGPRDLVRHVSMSPQEREEVKSLQNVTRMVRHFNHLAFFVASMILLRDKPKHRVRALEKFMNIAQVRHFQQKN